MSIAYSISRNALLVFTLLASPAFAQFTTQAPSTQAPSPAQPSPCVPYTYTGYPPKPAVHLDWQSSLQQAGLCDSAQQLGDAYQYFHAAFDSAPETEKPALWLKVQQAGEHLVHQLLEKVSDTSILGFADREFMLRFGNKEDAERVWDTTKGTSFRIPDATVITSTPTQAQVAVSDDALAAGTADFTLNLAAPPTTELSRGAKVTISGTFDSYTSMPIMLTIKDGSISPPTPTLEISKPGQNHRSRVSAPLDGPSAK